MAILRAVAILEHESGLSRDRAVNTFHFEGDPDQLALETIRDKVGAFYYAPQANGEQVGAFLANHLTGFTVKVYDVTVEPAGPPLLVSGVFGIPARNDPEVDLPSEVAMCLSFEGTPAAGLIQSRRRGRVFVGPLNLSAVDPNIGATAIPYPIFTETLRQAGSKLAADVDAQVEMVVYSRPFAGRPAGRFSKSGKPLAELPARAGFTVGVDRFWTDNAFDTQRRRGERPTSKTYLASAG